MTMKEQCQAAIYKWASETDQSNAALGLTDNAAFIKLVIILYRDHYNHLIQTGESEWVDSPEIEDILTRVKTGEMSNPIQ